MGLLLRTCAREERIFWEWDHATWLRVLGPTQVAFFQEHALPNITDIRQQVMAAAYLLQCFQDVQILGGYDRRSLANKVFGSERVTATLRTVEEMALGWGYSVHYQNAFRGVISEVLLVHGHPELEGGDTRPLRTLTFSSRDCSWSPHHVISLEPCAGTPWYC